MEKRLEDLVLEYQGTYSEEIFNTLYAKLFNPLCKYLQFNGVLKEDAEDILQEYFSRNFKNYLLKYDERKGASFRTYIKKILKFRVYSHYRNTSKLPVYPLDNISNYPSFDKPFPTISNIKLEQIILKSLTKIKNKNHRLILFLELIFPYKIPVKKLCKILGIKATLYRTWKSRAKKRFKMIAFQYKELFRDIKDPSDILIQRDLYILDKYLRDMIPLDITTNQKIKSSLEEILKINPTPHPYLNG